mmetsp:Transcript_15161/g.15353  ORF Transcript_15161/g.15353 Transcript_15161/m.15353 type:complete len:199 (-) Transcript_15161:369-965(-)
MLNNGLIEKDKETEKSAKDEEKEKDATGIPIKFHPGCTLKHGKLISRRKLSGQKKKLQTKLLITMQSDFYSPLLSWGDTNDEFSTGGGSIDLLDISSITAANRTEHKCMHGKTGFIIQTRDGDTYHFESTRDQRDATISLLQSVISTLVFNLVMGNDSHLTDTLSVNVAQKGSTHHILDVITHRLLDHNLKNSMYQKV